MTDRELLELAARAAGIVSVKPELDSKKHGICIGKRTMQWLTVYEEPVKYWNPLTDDGDALRLAVKLMIRVSVNRAFRLSIPGSVTVEYPDRDGVYFALGEAVTNGDPYAATRRATVRAAAEIGRQMEGPT